MIRAISNCGLSLTLIGHQFALMPSHHRPNPTNTQAPKYVAMDEIQPG